MFVMDEEKVTAGSRLGEISSVRTKMRHSGAGSRRKIAGKSSFGTWASLFRRVRNDCGSSVLDSSPPAMAPMLTDATFDPSPTASNRQISPSGPSHDPPSRKSGLLICRTKLRNRQSELSARGGHFERSHRGFQVADDPSCPTISTPIRSSVLSLRQSILPLFRRHFLSVRRSSSVSSSARIGGRPLWVGGHVVWDFLKKPDTPEVAVIDVVILNAVKDPSARNPRDPSLRSG